VIRTGIARTATITGAASLTAEDSHCPIAWLRYKTPFMLLGQANQ
jgi:hypothetical protein